MKKLLGSIFARSQSAESVRAASTPTTADGEASSSIPKRWGGFLLSSTPAPLPVNQEILKSVDVVLRGVAAHVKAAITKMLDGEAYDQEMKGLAEYVEQNVANLHAESCVLTLELLQSYFSSPMGLVLCEQTAFPSLVLDFISKMRIVAMKEELSNMVKLSQMGKQGPGHVEVAVSSIMTTEVGTLNANSTDSVAQHGVPGVFGAMLRSLELLMDCVIAIASNTTLIEMFRCELPNLIALSAEEYPSAAVFIRDCCLRALMSVSGRNFNAGLAWYLLDCKVVAKTIERMTNYALATTTTLETADRALQHCIISIPNQSIHASSRTRIDDSAAAAAVSEALGLTRSGGTSSDREETSSLASASSLLLSGEPNGRDLDPPIAPTPPEIFCLPKYDIRVGLRSLVYILERTHRFTLVLLEEFQTSGGYALLLRLLDTCTEEEIPTLLDILMSLMPLGGRSLDSSDTVERVAGGNVLGARNVHAFSTIRDLLLNYIAGPDRDTDLEVGVASQRRNEHLILQLLTQVLHIYTSDYYNFVCLEPKTRTLALLLTKLPYISFYDAQVIILRIVEYVCCAAKPDDPLPHEILSVVCGLFIAYDPLTYQDRPDILNPAAAVFSPDVLLKAIQEGSTSTLSALLCECLIKVLRNCEVNRYKQELSGFGLMDRGVYVWLGQITTCLSSVPETDVDTRHKILTALKSYLNLFGDLASLMLRHNYQECIHFRQGPMSIMLYAITDVLISSDVLVTPFDMVHERQSCSSGILSIFTELADTLRYTSNHEFDAQFTSSVTILQAGVESDLSFILELLQRFRGAIWRQVAIVYILMDMLKAGGLAIAPLWKSCQGYEILVALLSSLDLVDSESPECGFQMMELLLQVLTVTVNTQRDENHNADYFRSIHGYSTVASCIRTSGVIQNAERKIVLQRVFDLISGGLPQREIRNGDAVQIIFRLLPILPEIDAIESMTKLLSMFECASGATKKEQAIRLINAGAIEWINQPEIVSKVIQAEDPLNPFIVKWIMTIALEEDLSIPRLHNLLGLVGKAMPILLNKQNNLSQGTTEKNELLEKQETGLFLLQEILTNPAIRHISVGKPQGSGQTGRYVHIVNCADRVWPPSSGYSFSCWLRFPSVTVCDDNCPTEVTNHTVSVPLCEGVLSLVSGEDEKMEAYCVLMGKTLTLFSSSAHAARNEDAMATLDMKDIARHGPTEWSFVSNSRTYLVSCADADSMEMWWHVMDHYNVPSHIAGSSKSNDMLASFGVKREGGAAKPKPVHDSPRDAEEGSACIVSIYSLESSGCFVRAFFDLSTGFLRFHTGASTSGPSINPNPKRTSVAFETVVIDNLRPGNSPSSTSDGADNAGVEFSQMEQTERKRDWHHFAFTHRKAVVGSSLLTVYIDGMELATKKLNYPSASSVGTYQAFIGSDAQVCSPQSALSWKVGPTWLIDEVVPNSTIAGIFSLGPTFSHQFSGHSYRSVGDWPEALASSHLARAADRGIDIEQFAQRLQLARLGRSCRRDWYEHNGVTSNPQSAGSDSVAAGATLITESMMAKKEELAEGLRLATGGVPYRKEKNKVVGFRKFVSYDCAMSSFGTEIEALLGSCKLPEDNILFTLNSSSGDRSMTPIQFHTQVHFINCAQSCHLDLARSLPFVGGIGQVLFPLLDNATRQCDFYLVLNMLINVLRRNPSCLAECIASSGYSFIAALLCSRIHLIDEKVLTSVIHLAVAGKLVPYAFTNAEMTTQNLVEHPVIVDAVALAQVVLNGELRKKLPHHLQCQLVSLLMDLLVVSNPNALFNARQLRRAGLIQWILSYLTDLGNEDCRLDQATALEMRWCFPKFSEPTFEAILQYALSLMLAFMRIESHVDDCRGISEILLLSMANTTLHNRQNPIRVILLQFVLHEIENDATLRENNKPTDHSPKWLASSASYISDTIVEAILYREGDIPVAKKHDDKRIENDNSLETASLGSPLADSSSILGKGFTSSYPSDGFATVLLEVIDRGHENVSSITAEALLAIRILLSLAQSHPVFAEHLLCQTVSLQKLKRGLWEYSTDCCVYIPLLAYVSNIPISDTSYYDPDTLFAAELGPKSFLSTGRCVDQVWDLIGELLLRNCRLTDRTIATEVNIIVLGKIAFQVESSPSFFAAVCKSSGTLLRIIAQCLLSYPDEDNEATSKTTSNQDPTAVISSTPDNSSDILYDTLHELTRMVTEMSVPRSNSAAFVNLIQVIMSRSLGTDEFVSLMMLFLEILDETNVKQGGSFLARISGQKYWLTLLKHLIEKQDAMKSNVTLTSLKNLCTLCVALARYLGDEDNHHLKASSTNQAQVSSTLSSVLGNSNSNVLACFGVEVLHFFLSCCELCSQPAIVQAFGMEERQFFYGTLIYSAQTVVLNELGGVHRDGVSVQHIMVCLVEFKHILLQRPDWQGTIVCGIVAQSTNEDTNSGTDFQNTTTALGRPSRRIYKVRSLSANAHKEFGIGMESDRSFILSLTSLLYRMLMDDSTKLRHSAIVVWQFLIDQRFDVLKELLIAESRSSVLHTITSTKKDAAIDVFHGGFDRLLYVLHVPDTESTRKSGQANFDDLSLNQDIWCQFQLWLAENNELMTEVIVTRTQSIYQQVQEVLLSCIRLRYGSGANEICLETNFPVQHDTRKGTSKSEVNDAFESSGFDMVVKKAEMKYASIRDSVLESMNDGLSQWREMSFRLTYTRNVWQTGKWQINELVGDDFEIETKSDTQQSIFQRKSIGYRLDSTEGPHRMRLRLLRDYLYENRSRTMPVVANENQPNEADGNLIVAKDSCLQIRNKAERQDSEPFHRSLEFHEAVEIFKEFVYQQAPVTNRSENNMHLLTHILSRCRMDSTREIFSRIVEPKEGNQESGNVSVLMVAYAVHSAFLEGEEYSGEKSSMGVALSIIEDIRRILEIAEASPNMYCIPSTIFDAADAEATQYALCTVQHESLRSIRLDVPIMPENAAEAERDVSGDELDDGIPTESGHPVDAAESDDSDCQENVKMTDLVKITALPQQTDQTQDTINLSTLEPTSPKTDQYTYKQVDTSYDAVYGAIARFLRRDDYPPLRSFNAAYIAGMGKTPGLFVICRFGIYFIGGYSKLYNNMDTHHVGDSKTMQEATLKSSEEAVSSQPNFESGKSTNTPTEGRRKTTKRKLRAALTDFGMQFAPSKAGCELFFTVVPLLDFNIQPGGLLNGESLQPAANSRWSIKYSNVKQFCRIKYQLRPVGIEFFDTFGLTYFLQLEASSDREEVVKLLFQMPLVNSIFWSPVLRTGALVPSIKKIRQAVTKRWLRGFITNFEYLIHLNTLAGRSFNDITQYPVFPWVIADYTSSVLDLEARDTFRDLSKPMGALGESRAAQFRERYSSLSQDLDAEGSMETPAFHYGTHYSCSAYVVNYLIRLEPFTALALELQGGEFDHPDRLFRSIPASWISASRDNLQDVRELIPEFFYLPEFLYNANNCAFGTTQTGEEVSHVILPPWAHGDPREFVRLNRRALESKYVSEHLHDWIDLVFGVKQTGKAAVEAQNVFMHFTYEGTVDIEQITDPVMRAATLAQIENFGQTPSRLFSTPHPQRKVPTLQTTNSMSGSASESTQSMNPSVGHQYDGITLSTIEAYVKWHTPLAPALVAIGKDYVFLKKHSVVSVQVNGSAIGDVKLVHDKMQCQSIGCIFMPPRYAKYLDWGNNSGMMKLRVHQQYPGANRYRETNKVLAVIEGAHHDGINCASVSNDGALLVTGGQDAVVNLIECTKASDGRRVFKQVAKFVGHSNAVVCVAINKEFNLIASSSVDRSVLLWDLRTRALLQELAGHSSTVAHVSINCANGNVLTTTGSEIRLWSINGDLLAASSSSVFGLQTITCAISTRCESWQNGVIAVTGHANGAIALWGLRYPDDLARQRKEAANTEAAATTKESGEQPLTTSSISCTSPTSSKRVDPADLPVPIQSQRIASRTRAQVIPSCQFFILKLLLDHRTKVTALTLGTEQRQLLSGDADGNCIRWVDDSISTSIH